MSDDALFLFLSWAVYGIFNYIAVYAYVREERPLIARRKAMAVAIVAGLSGTFGVPAVVLGTKFLKHSYSAAN